MSRVPGNFSHQFVGQRKQVVSGWRDFDPFHPHAVVSAPNSQLASLTVNSSRQLVATYNDAIGTAGTRLTSADCYSIPLTGKDGTAVTFADSFLLKTQIEIISTSGDIDNATNYARPFFGIGFGQTADADDSTNHAFGAGYWLHDSNASNVVIPRTAFFKTTASDTHSEVHNNDSSNINVNALHLLCDYYIGPAIGSALSEAGTVVCANWVGRNQSGSYEKETSGAGAHEFSNQAGVFDGDGQVYLYVFYGIRTAIDGSQDPPVITTRMRYMVNHNLGKDGTAAL
jgi:hypothetical protein